MDRLCKAFVIAMLLVGAIFFVIAYVGHEYDWAGYLGAMFAIAAVVAMFRK